MVREADFGLAAAVSLALACLEAWCVGDSEVGNVVALYLMAASLCAAAIFGLGAAWVALTAKVNRWRGRER